MKLAVVLFNLGGPDRPEAVRPFLFNLFFDPAIIRLPAPLRWLVATVIAGRRAPFAREIYAYLGGASPLLPETRAQAEALAAALGGEHEVRVFIAMRYWHPRAIRTARELADWGADRVVLLPLYPQYSTTTTRSSLAEWRKVAGRAGLRAPARAICCWPMQAGLVEAQARLIAAALDAAGGDARLLLSAHGLPQRVVDDGDPYQWQVERTCGAVLAALARLGHAGLDSVVCYQSRVGPLQWIGPSTDDEVRRAGRDGRAVVVAPIAFVSEHSETLVELDIEYRRLAQEAGVPAYHRVPAVGTDPAFIGGLAALVRQALANGGRNPAPDGGTRLCPRAYRRCALEEAG